MVNELRLQLWRLEKLAGRGCTREINEMNDATRGRTHKIERLSHALNARRCLAE